MNIVTTPAFLATTFGAVMLGAGILLCLTMLLPIKWYDVTHFMYTPMVSIGAILIAVGSFATNAQISSKVSDLSDSTVSLNEALAAEKEARASAEDLAARLSEAKDASGTYSLKFDPDHTIDLHFYEGAFVGDNTFGDSAVIRFMDRYETTYTNSNIRTDDKDTILDQFERLDYKYTRMTVEGQTMYLGFKEIAKDVYQYEFFEDIGLDTFLQVDIKDYTLITHDAIEAGDILFGNPETAMSQNQRDAEERAIEAELEAEKQKTGDDTAKEAVKDTDRSESENAISDTASGNAVSNNLIEEQSGDETITEETSEDVPTDEASKETEIRESDNPNDYIVVSQEFDKVADMVSKAVSIFYYK